MSLKRRILDIAVKYKISHLNSALSCVDIIDRIYEQKQEGEPFVLSNGHTALALYVVLEKKYGVNAEVLWNESGTHPTRGDLIYCSTGSLGMGLPVAVGMAIADRNKNVYCVISDGECDEGSVWESLRFVHLTGLNNLKIWVNLNGWSAYNKINKDYLIARLKQFHEEINIVETYSGEDWGAHYYAPTEKDYEENLRRLNLSGNEY